MRLAYIVAISVSVDVVVDISVVVDSAVLVLISVDVDIAVLMLVSVVVDNDMLVLVSVMVETLVEAGSVLMVASVSSFPSVVGNCVEGNLRVDCLHGRGVAGLGGCCCTRDGRSPETGRRSGCDHGYRYVSVCSSLF